jgi:hypothetical protein
MEMFNGSISLSETAEKVLSFFEKEGLRRIVELKFLLVFLRMGQTE